MALFDTIRAGASGAAEDFVIERSLRFSRDDDCDLQKTFSSAGNRKVWTWSSWIKRGTCSNDYRQIFRAGATMVRFKNDHTLMFERSGGAVSTASVFRDVSAWYHIVFALDTTQSTESNRIKVYVNSVEQTLSGTFPAQNTDYDINNNVNHFIGQNTANSEFFDGYMAEVNFIDGQALTPSSFAETNTETGQWIPKNTSGLTFGTNGFRLQFLDNSGTSATTLGKDTSGNGNNFTPNNFSVSAGINNDSLTDTPTNNFCTLNFNDRSNSADTRDGNLTLYTDSNDQAATGTFAVKSGKWYWEVDKNDAEPEIGIAHHNMPLSNKSVSLGSDGQIAFIVSGADSNTNFLRVDGNTQTGTGMSAQTGTGSIGIALDMDNKKIWWSDLSGNYFNSGNPATGANAQVDFSSTGPNYPTGFVTPFVSMYQGSAKTVSINFGQRPFTHTQPTGFKTLCSADLPDPTILLPNEHFNTLLYTGNDSSDRDITGVGFQPDWLWIKNRSQADNHMLSDAIRGANTTFFINTDGEDANNSNGHVNSFLADGFNVDAGAGGNVNENNENYVSWNWNAGGSTVTNSTGTISSQVRANATAGFSLVGYSGTGTNSDSVGHGLGVTPDAVFIKQRIGASNWIFESPHTYNAKGMYLNHNDGSNTGGTDTTSRSSTLVTFDNSSDSNRRVNFSGSNYLMYCFSSVSGYSEIGQYTGNGSTNGTFVFTGFRPAMIILKRTNSAAAWIIHDDKRAGFNPHNDYLQPDDTTAESDGSGGTLDILSNGFKLRSTPGTHNGNGDSYTYLAFAQASFKYARAR